MPSFLKQVAKHLLGHHPNLDSLVLILPSNRAATFLGKALSECITKPTLLPKLVSIENFVAQLSKLDSINAYELPLKLYEAYTSIKPADAGTYADFITWGETLLNDFDEIDRYLIHQTQLFEYLTAANEIKTWYLQPKNQTSLIRNHFAFLQEIRPIYNSLQQHLGQDSMGYQGKRYREAVNNLKEYIDTHPELHYGFIGFNALNKAEETIIKLLLDNNKVTLYYDLDPYFKEDKIHAANYYIKTHTRQWSNYQNSLWFSTDNSYTAKKTINITGLPKNSSQAKYIGALLNQLSDSISQAPVALVLSDESLLPLVLHSIPETIMDINVTMGYPLVNTETSLFINQLLSLFSKPSKLGWLGHELQTLLSNPLFQTYLNQTDKQAAQRILATIQKQNYRTISSTQLANWIPATLEALHNICTETPSRTATFISLIRQIFYHIAPKFEAEANHLELQAVETYKLILEELETITNQKDYLHQLQNSEPLLHSLTQNKTLDLKGNPFKGLQIMGMLETRCLDFETVIIMSVNEGVLPAGKTQNSFIPLDAKIEFGLPTYQEKDAVYTYHFYRLLQRADTVYLTYNTEPDVLEGGEKSRLISQLLTDETINKYITHTITSPNIPIALKASHEIKKPDSLLTRLADLCRSGLSPTSLSTYINDSYAFYKRYILKLEEPQILSDTIAPNLFGTIIHDSLEELYTPFLDKQLLPDELAKVKPNIAHIVQRQFAKTYSDASITTGQNLIVFEVLVKYIHSQLDYEIQQSTHHEIILLGLEQKLEILLDVPNAPIPVKIKGKLDRIDRFDGMTRILDYKTGKVETTNVQIHSFEEVITEESKNKAFQLLCYALMYSKTAKVNTLTAGIIPIKNMQNGTLTYAFKTGNKATDKNEILTMESLVLFETTLIGLISTMFDTHTNFKPAEA